MTRMQEGASLLSARPWSCRQGLRRCAHLWEIHGRCSREALRSSHESVRGQKKYSVRGLTCPCSSARGTHTHSRDATRQHHSVAPGATHGSTHAQRRALERAHFAWGRQPVRCQPTALLMDCTCMHACICMEAVRYTAPPFDARAPPACMHACAGQCTLRTQVHMHARCRAAVPRTPLARSARRSMHACMHALGRAVRRAALTLEYTWSTATATFCGVHSTLRRNSGSGMSCSFLLEKKSMLIWSQSCQADTRTRARVSRRRSA